MWRFLLVLFIGLTVSGCAYIGKPNAVVDNKTLLLSVTNADAHAWQDCTFTLNPNSTADKQFSYVVTQFPGKETRNLILTQFKNVAEKRYIPVMDKIKGLEIKCAQPMFPVTIDL